MFAVRRGTRRAGTPVPLPLLLLLPSSWRNPLAGFPAMATLAQPL
jgi:hypothetical protein